jgi:putative flippase GtrA
VSRYSGRLWQLSKRKMPRFWCFCLIGAIGFTVDAALLVLLLAVTEFGPLLSRAISFALAVLTTWVLNRGWAFRDVRGGDVVRELILYLFIQGFGIGINFSVYSLLVVFAVQPLSLPIFALVIASAIALTFNYLGLSRMVFVKADRK